VLANTLGAVCGSLAVGFVLLPVLESAQCDLLSVAGLAVVQLHIVTFASSPAPRMASGHCSWRRSTALWLLLPADYVITRALPSPGPNERLLSLREGVTEVVSITEAPDTGRTLVTNGHPMSSTRRLSQRYMRALAHIPLLSMDHPEVVLVIGFGVGNTTHAATLHPSVRRVEIADLSRDILRHSSYFAESNQNVLNDPRVVVYVNDGRHHLHMQSPASYDLITLEPPPIAYAGVAAPIPASSTMRTRRNRTDMSQQLPRIRCRRHHVGNDSGVCRHVPQAVLISGAESTCFDGVNDSASRSTLFMWPRLVGRAGCGSDPATDPGAFATVGAFAGRRRRLGRRPATRPL
jgi:hypothetical protein